MGNAGGRRSVSTPLSRNRTGYQVSRTVNAHLGIAAGYPARASAPKRFDTPAYHPPDYTAPSVLVADVSRMPAGGNPRAYWADPADPRQARPDGRFPSYAGKIRTDATGHPLNPYGPTGVAGRGLLGRWGANFAADPIVTRTNGRGQLELILIRRADTGHWALPGGMVDRGERATATVKRELGEEAAAHLNFHRAHNVYQGYVADPRNTDNAWMETDAYHLHLSRTQGARTALRAGDDATAAAWHVVTPSLLRSLYANHGALVNQALSQWQRRTGNTLDRSGRVVAPTSA